MAVGKNCMILKVPFFDSLLYIAEVYIAVAKKVTEGAPKPLARLNVRFVTRF